MRGPSRCRSTPPAARPPQPPVIHEGKPPARGPRRVSKEALQCEDKAQEGGAAFGRLSSHTWSLSTHRGGAYPSSPAPPVAQPSSLPCRALVPGELCPPPSPADSYLWSPAIRAKRPLSSDGSEARSSDGAPTDATSNPETSNPESSEEDEEVELLETALLRAAPAAARPAAPPPVTREEGPPATKLGGAAWRLGPIQKRLALDVARIDDQVREGGAAFGRSAGTPEPHQEDQPLSSLPRRRLVSGERCPPPHRRPWYR